VRSEAIFGHPQVTAFDEAAIWAAAVLAFLIFLALLSLVIIIHEFGHAAARWTVGAKVQLVEIGRGPAISIKRGDFTFALHLVPLGGRTVGPPRDLPGD
jgi:hypothetical protein